MPRDDAALWLELCAHCDGQGLKPREVVFNLIAKYLDEVKGDNFGLAIVTTNARGKLC